MKTTDSEKIHGGKMANLHCIGSLGRTTRITDLVKAVGAPTEHALIGQPSTAMCHPEPKFDDFGRPG
jgi:hypothetical protein